MGRKSKQLKDAKYFKAFLIEKYAKLIEEYNIQVERAEPYKEEDLKKDKRFCEYEAEIYSKSGTNYDAKNIYLIENKRNPDEINLQSSITIFISADKELQRWDSEREKITAPVVVAPNIWLLLLARLIGRSEDDRECFISYINLPFKEPTITNKEIFEVVNVINELVDDVKQQESVLDVMVEEEFSFLYNGSEKKNTEYIRQKTEEKTYEILSNRVTGLEKKIEKMSDENFRLRNEISQKISTIEEKDTTIQEQYLVIVENERLNETEQLKKYEEFESLRRDNERLRIKINIIYIIVLVLFFLILNFCVFHEIIDIYYFKNKNPISYKIFCEIIHDTLQDGDNNIQQYFSFAKAIVLLVVTGIDVKIIKVIYKVLKKETKKR